MVDGEYLATSYEKQMFRGAEEKVFFLLSIAENREPTTDAEAPVWVYFLQEEAQKPIFQNSRGVCFPG